MIKHDWRLVVPASSIIGLFDICLLFYVKHLTDHVVEHGLWARDVVVYARCGSNFTSDLAHEYLDLFVVDAQLVEVLYVVYRFNY